MYMLSLIISKTTKTNVDDDEKKEKLTDKINVKKIITIKNTILIYIHMYVYQNYIYIYSNPKNIMINVYLVCSF